MWNLGRSISARWLVVELSRDPLSQASAALPPASAATQEKLTLPPRSCGRSPIAGTKTTLLSFVTTWRGSFMKPPHWHPWAKSYLEMICTIATFFSLNCGIFHWRRMLWVAAAPPQMSGKHIVSCQSTAHISHADPTLESPGNPQIQLPFTGWEAEAGKG